MKDKVFITRTKILIPHLRKEILSRPRLLEMLNELLDFKLIIIAAPAGYGKTSLMIDFAHHFQWPVCWYALDEFDQNPIRFIAHFISAIKERFPEFGNVSLDAIESSSEDEINLDFIVSTIVNDIYDHIAEHFIIVLDDYHLINEGKDVDQFISTFLQRVGENCHLVIMSRKLLALPELPLLVAHNEVGGMSIDELSFLPEEIQQYYQQNFQLSINLSKAQLLATQSEGWITGLLLTAQINQQQIGDRLQIARASGIGLYEYLAEQVLDSQPPEIKDFLLRSSLLEEFDAPLCSQIIGKALSIQENWMHLIEKAIYDNLFVLRVGDEEQWFRYHHLFRDFLQERMHQLHPDEEKKILLELTNYYSQSENYDQVIVIYKKIEDNERIIDLLKQVGVHFMSAGKVHKLAEWFEGIPISAIQNNLEVLALRASVEINLGEIQTGLELLNTVINKLVSHKEKPELIAENLIRRSTAHRMLGEYSSSLEDAEKALEIIAELPDANLLHAEAFRVKGFNLYQQGNITEARTWLGEALKNYADMQYLEDVARLQVEIGAVNETLGDFSAAEKAYKESLTYWRQSGDSIWQANLYNNLGVLQHAMGNFENSLQSLEKAMQYAQANGNTRMEGYALASIGDLYKDLGASKEALDAYRNAMEIAQRIGEQFLVFYIRLAMARQYVLEKDFKTADALIQSAEKIAKKSGSEMEMNKFLLESGISAFSQNNFLKAETNIKGCKNYFLKEHQIEDAIHSTLYLSLTYAEQEDFPSAINELDMILEQLESQNKITPILIASSEISGHLRRLANNKIISKPVQRILERVDIFQQETQKIRRKIRKEASIVPISEPHLTIHGLGRCEVYSNGELIRSTDWMSQTSRDLLFLFLAFPEGLSKEEVGLWFWPDLSPQELRLRFKNTLYRLRRAVGNEVIIFNDTFYQFNHALDFEYDVTNFNQLITDADIEKNPNEKIALLQRAIECYKGPYLQGIDADWVLPERQHYRDLFLQALQSLIQKYIQINEYKLALQVVRRALDEDKYSEETYRLAMQIYFALGNKGMIAQQYEICKRILQSDIGASPSKITTQLYERLMNE